MHSRRQIGQSGRGRGGGGLKTFSAFHLTPEHTENLIPERHLAATGNRDKLVTIGICARSDR